MFNQIAPPASSRESKRKSTLLIVQLAVLLALEALVCFTPLGSIPFTPVIVATFSHVPVIIAAVLLGPAVGAGMGFSFGLFSFLVWTFMPPNPFSGFLFTPVTTAPGAASGNLFSLLICFVPRILVGVVAGFAYKALSKTPKPVSMSAAAILGTLTNTVFVLGGAYGFFPEVNAGAHGFFTFVILNAGWNGLLEIAAAVILTAPVCIAVQRATKKL
ncbi:MAG: ECF transporter S component [Oscillospiraceae bacterium]|jgi:uncharacterized membrane protein|nr:ECF transporter S component [Oscillospiraceae bacterium]